MKNMGDKGLASGSMRLRKIAAATAAAVAASGSALAFDIDTGNPDLKVRWDNTVRLNLAQRVGSRDAKIGAWANSDEGTYSFNNGAMVAKRLDLLSELDVVLDRNKGFRVSGAAWYDAAYGSTDKSNPALPAAFASYAGNQLSPYVKRFYAGPSGEILDAFVFGNFDMGGVPVKLKAGRHTVFWGESMFLNGALHSVSYAQMPIDLQKGFATPGTEAKELFRPLNQISGQAQVSDTLSIAAQYFLQWEAYRYPEGGTYLGPVDLAFNGPTGTAAPGVGYVFRGNAAEPKQVGEYGLSARWSPEVLDGTLGFYYRRYADKLPQALLTKMTALGAPTNQYNLVYASGIDMYGISLGKNIAGVSVGAEASYRRNTPLVAPLLGNAAASVAANGGAISQGETYGPRGNTWHALVNLMGVVPKTGVFDTATWAGELTYSRLDSVTSGANLFNGVGYASCKDVNGAASAGSKWDGCATKDYVGLSLAFTPTWYQVMAGVDLSAPISYSVGLSGNAATMFGGNEGNGSYSVGLGADIFQKYKVDLKWIGYFGRYNLNPAGTAVQTVNGFTTLLKDRDFISLTLKTSF
ncbi:MAG: DUF1302 domain-containing protein [Rhodocyclaceae bacterium]|nr:DUF1302 domain-containing protein [Rhodocyclaceae bacterium]